MELLRAVKVESPPLSTLSASYRTQRKSMTLLVMLPRSMLAPSKPTSQAPPPPFVDDDQYQYNQVQVPCISSGQ